MVAKIDSIPLQLPPEGEIAAMQPKGLSTHTKWMIRLPKYLDYYEVYNDTVCTLLPL